MMKSIILGRTGIETGVIGLGLEHLQNASFEETAAMGTESVRLFSARARGPVSVLALGKADLDALSVNFPLLASRVLMRLAGIMATRLQLLLDAQFLEEPEEPQEAEE